MSKPTAAQEPKMAAIPTNEMDATTLPIFSVYAPRFRTSHLISRNITYSRARRIAENYGALVYLTADLEYLGLA